MKVAVAHIGTPQMYNAALCADIADGSRVLRSFQVYGAKDATAEKVSSFSIQFPLC